MGEDQIPPKLVKIAGEFFVKPLTDIINSCLYSSSFLDLQKETQKHQLTVKGGTDKHTSTN